MLAPDYYSLNIPPSVLGDYKKEHENWINSFLSEIREKLKYDESKKKKAIRDLQQHLNQEMSEMNDESKKMFYETAMTKTFDLIMAENNTHDIKCGIMLMCILLDATLTESNKPPICAPFAHHLRNVNLNIYDLELLDLIACAIGKIAQNSGPTTPNFVEFEVRRAIEVILNDQDQKVIKRHSAILNLRELANVSPSFFFNYVMIFFESIFTAINDSKLREPAISALRSVLNVIVERERLASITLPSSNSIHQVDQQIPRCFQICFEEVNRVFEEIKDVGVGKHQKDFDDKIHAALLILNELLRCSQKSSGLFKDSFSSEIDFSDISTFDLSQYLFTNFDNPVASTVTSSIGGTNITPPSVPSTGTSTSSLTSSSSSSTLNRMAVDRANQPSGTSSSYLTKLFRNTSNVDNKPLYRLRDLNSVVNYHKENGIAPILSFFHKSKQIISSDSCRLLIIKNYDQICQHVRNLMTMKNSVSVNRVLLILLPSLVQFQSKKFCERDGYVADSIAYLVNMIKMNNHRSLAFISLGLFALSIQLDESQTDSKAQDKFDEHIETIIQQIRTAFTPKDTKKRTVTPDPAVFICIAFIAQAFGPKVAKDVRNLLPAMFKVGLTEPLANSLYNICKYINELELEIHGGLLKILSSIIFNSQMMPRMLCDNSFVADINVPNVGDNIDIETLKLALKVLGRFTFSWHYPMSFAIFCANTYLIHENREIRLEAVPTCCHLLKPFLMPSSSVERLTKEVLSKLLVVGITDTDKYVRYSVLSRLDENFDYYLAQSENLALLQISINDEVFEIRELGICILGRLCSLNPAYVMPHLRKVLLSLLNELENSGIAKNMEQSARMLGHLLAATPRLIRPYTEPLIKVFLPKLTDPSQAVILAVMSAIGEQTMVSGLEMRSYFYQLFPILLDAIQDQTSFQKREISLWTMGRLIENCGFVIEPYWKFPTLLDCLLNILKSESTKQSMMIRQETIRVLGLLGAVDPYRHKVNLGVIDLSGESLISCDPLSEHQLNVQELLTVANNFDDYYSAQAIEILMKVMNDQNSNAQHTMAVQAVAFIFCVLKTRSVQYLPHILPPFINIIRNGEAKIKEFLLQQLGRIISVVKKHIRCYLDDIFKVLRELWSNCTPTNPTMQMTLFNVVDQIVLALGGEFRNYVPHLIPHIMRVLNHDSSRRKEVTHKLLTALQNFGTNLEDYVNLLIPSIVKLFQTNSTSDNKKDNDIRILALKTISVFCDDLRLTDYATLIVHAIIKTIDDNYMDKKLVMTAMDTLTKFTQQMGSGFKIYIPIVAKTLERCKVSHAQYEMFVHKVEIGIEIEEVWTGRSRKRSRETRDQHSPNAEPKRTPVTLADLEKQFKNESSKKISKEDWLEWLRKLNVYLINESPSLSLRSCFPIAMSSNAVARELFNPAFLSFWYELSSDDQKRMVNLIQNALREQEIPEVTLILLNLAEFLERIDLTATGCEIFDAKILAERAIKCRSYAKALHYKEKEFGLDAPTEVFGALITINNKLQADFAAYGVLNMAITKCKGIDSFEVKEKWFEKLGNWESALSAYKSRCDQNPKDFDSIVGQMRCLEELSEWEKLYKLAQDTFPEASETNHQRMSRMAANASWNLNKWGDLVNYADHISQESFDSYFFKAVITIHQGHYSLAQFFIDKARQLIDSDLTSMASESYNRAYQTMIQVQLFSELEEVIQFKLVPERRDMIKQKWWQRLQGVQRHVEDWQKILQVHSLVLTPKEDIKSWLKFTKLCDRYRRTDLTLKTIGRIFGGNPVKALRRSSSANANLIAQPHFGEVTLRLIDHLWMNRYFKSAFVELHKLIEVLEKPMMMGMHDSMGQISQFSISATPSAASDLDTLNLKESGRSVLNGLTNIGNEMARANQLIINKVLSRAYLKMAEWSEYLCGFNEHTIRSILDFHKKATECDQTWYKAWHTWAFMNFRALKHLKENNPDLKKNLESDKHNTRQDLKLNAKDFCKSAVKGFFYGIKISQGSSLQDTLRILTLWFEDGHDREVRQEVEDGIKNVPIETWLQVIPQLIARIDTSNKEVAKLIHLLLVDIGKSHPQALIYPLTVASKSQTITRRLAATEILQLMKVHSPNLVNQAILVSEELIRIAILWHELWHEGLEEASRLYFGEKNIEGMFETLWPLHQMINRKALTYKELTFGQNYGADLNAAQLLCQQYKLTKKIDLLNQAWDVYYRVFRKISRQLNQLTSLELQYVSPKLCECLDLELAVPGSYNPNRELIKIAKVEAHLTIITSKQRPRKLTIKGSNGMNYMFLLKGHEDLRQDERVMQLFGLVNTLLNKNISTSNRNLSIQRYAVIPLSPNSGLIGWVPCCDTLHSLIRDYREKKKVLLNMEHRLMLRMAPEYDRLTLMQKVEVFEHALDNTPGNDLAKIMWLKSPNSESWFDRRTNYTRSLAVMSMVGYILGLGDRHPSNLMLDQKSGKILHIDFGDCFEVAMIREKYPEKIPFRLTRMLVKAMEATGVEGTYRVTASQVMLVLRKNRESLMALLEAFVYDPLLNWRLQEVRNPRDKAMKPGNNEGLQYNIEPGVLDLDGTVDVDDRPAIIKTVNRPTERGDPTFNEGQNQKALEVIKRVRDKLTGRDFERFIGKPNFTTYDQVAMLIQQATSHENLCQCYIGWCPFW